MCFLGKCKNHTGFSSKVLRSYLTKQKTRSTLEEHGTFSASSFSYFVLPTLWILVLSSAETSLAADKQSAHFRLSEHRVPLLEDSWPSCHFHSCVCWWLPSLSSLNPKLHVGMTWVHFMPLLFSQCQPVIEHNRCSISIHQSINERMNQGMNEKMNKWKRE